MRVLILGGSGMLGHKLWQIFAPRFDTYLTFRCETESYARFGIFDMSRALGGVTAENFASVMQAFSVVRPDVVINCVGIVKQDVAAKDHVASITVNALFPHSLAALCHDRGTRLIHLSTDCVFSGHKGNYSEGDTPDAQDLYGRTKLLGEVDRENCMTIRTSMIGRELAGTQGLLEWFLEQEGKRVRGFKHAVFSGFTTPALSEVIANVVAEQPELHGIWHVASQAIGKFDLLTLVKQTYGLEIEIEPDEAFICDRSLDGSRFHQATGIKAPAWPEMIENMLADSTPYDEIRRGHAS